MLKWTNFIIEGIDRLGKSTLIESIKRHDGYYHVIHYGKPPSYQNPDLVKTYQSISFAAGFDLMQQTCHTPVIMDRFHIGEMVYAPLYRGYSGEYVYDVEKSFLDTYPRAKQDIRLILLTTSNFDIIEDDGESFDFSKKEEEQKMFIDAVKKSELNTVIIDVHNGEGGYKTADEVYLEATAGLLHN